MFASLTVVSGILPVSQLALSCMGESTFCSNLAVISSHDRGALHCTQEGTEPRINGPQSLCTLNLSHLFFLHLNILMCTVFSFLVCLVLVCECACVCATTNTNFIKHQKYTKYYIQVSLSVCPSLYHDF